MSSSVPTDKNRLSLVCPEISKEWDYDKNYPFTPNDVTYSSGFDRWWKCGKCQNTWLAPPQDRHHKHSGCPHCTKYSNTSVALNNLFILNPELAKEWHPTKNGILTPQTIAHKSGKRVWWQCSQKHEWQAVVRHRANGSGCPYCSGRLASPTHNLMVQSPFLSREWDYDKNYPLTPFNFAGGSHKKVWWKCSVCNNSWAAGIHGRWGGENCPKCRKIVLKDGAVCDSVIEAHFYLRFQRKKISFLHHGFYGGSLGKCVYDFYLPDLNQYVEVTCYDKRFKYWYRYLRKIVRKKQYVEQVLGANFKFIQRNLNGSESDVVRANRLIS